MIDPAWANAGIVAAGVGVTVLLNKRSESRREGAVDSFITATSARLTKHGEEIDSVKQELGAVRERVGRVETRCDVLHGRRISEAGD